MAKRKGQTEKACATRRLLLDAALDVIGQKGYSAATVDEIVEVAGVSKGVAYYHFKSKADMAESILEEGIGRIVTGFECIAAEAPTAADALTGMIELFASGIFENKAFGRFFVSELWREGRVWSGAMRGHERRLLAVLEGQLRRGQAEGAIRPEVDPVFEAVALVGMVLTTTLFYLGGREVEGADAAGAALGVEAAPMADAASAMGVAGAGALEGAAGAANASALAASDAAEAGVLKGVEAAAVSDALEESALGVASAASDAAGDKDAFIEKICDFVRHANKRAGVSV